MNSGSDIEPSSEDLDVSMTQSPLVLFIPYSLAVILCTGMFAVGTFFHTWKTFLLVPMIWAAAAVWIRRDPNALQVLHVRLRLLAVWLTAHPWDGWSVNLPDHRARKAPSDAI